MEPQWYRPRLESWYRPPGQAAGLADWAAGPQLEQLSLLNRLIPYFGIEDVGDIARSLYAAAGGPQGPFQHYADPGMVPAGARNIEEQRMPRGTQEWVPGAQNEHQILWQAAQAVREADMEPGLRDWITGAINLALPLTRNEPQEGLFGRTREQQIRLQSELENYLGQVPNVPDPETGSNLAAPWANWLSMLIMPTRFRPLPGAMTFSPGARRGYTVLPNPRYF